jgi:2-phosphoglycerate kinase
MMMDGMLDSKETLDYELAASAVLRNSRVIYIAGMSGIGKTKLSVEAAKLVGKAEVINMDSLQVYKVGICIIRERM